MDFRLADHQTTGGIIIFGVGVQLTGGICLSAVYLCIGFYATSKVLIYAYLSTLFPRSLVVKSDIVPLVEKVHVVWSPTTGAKRLKSTIYVACTVVLSMYGVVLALMTLVGKSLAIMLTFRVLSASQEKYTSSGRTGFVSSVSNR